MLSAALLLFANTLLFSLRLSGGGSFPKPLPASEEREYLHRCASGDTEARNVLIERNLRLVAHIVKKYYTQNADQEDLISIGTIGLGSCKADNNISALREVFITRETRTEEYLKDTVRSIVSAICATLEEVKKAYPQLCVNLSEHVSFVTTQQLEDLWPDLTPRQRENAYVEQHPTAFIMQIGAPLASGKPHDGRAPDYDDWSLNGDLLFWDDVLGCALEVSSMGIRVDAEAMERQCKAAGCPHRLELPFHKAVLDGTLPLTMGGGIGQSRLCMLLLGKAHIGEVQASLWPKAIREQCEAAGIPLL